MHFYEHFLRNILGVFLNALTQVHVIDQPLKFATNGLELRVAQHGESKKGTRDYDQNGICSRNT